MKKIEVYVVKRSRDRHVYEQDYFVRVIEDRKAVFGKKLYDEDFYGRWTEDKEEFERDKNVKLLVEILFDVCV